ncbi:MULTISPECIES: YeeE/YedE family protein [Paracoccus]|uniref:YeeE/YedE family protein n=1 Tax=Paracoccus TaxID=265 RepID=UPI000786227D|nr:MULTISPECIES: YeeE/YedE thiosulfate transporter family protein [Paracoccus]MCV2446426.1 YeeE/YedE thiosulfate transporter family protein [Paracoccus sp. DMF]MDQ7775522.1 YeeE/YedE thiosulfate transporter family protein [Paracoccus aminovorans]
MTDFTPLHSALGGALIGLAAVLLMAALGRVAGMTGILSGAIFERGRGWRLAFLLGAVAAPALMRAAGVEIAFDSPVPQPWLVVGGLLVGIGVSYGGGCTSGHGVCGNARLSPRSLVATGCFMAAAFATVFVIRHLIGGF